MENRFKVNNREGLIGEFLSKVERRDAAHPYITWPIACDNPDHEEQSTHYINVGVWTSHERFFEEVGRNMNDERPPLEFEIERRRRVAITPCGMAPRPSRIAH